MSGVIVLLVCHRQRLRVVEVDVEKELVIGVWMSLAKLALNGAIAGADLIAEYISNHTPDILYLSKLWCGPVVK